MKWTTPLWNKRWLHSGHNNNSDPSNDYSSKAQTLGTSIQGTIKQWQQRIFPERQTSGSISDFPAFIQQLR